MIKTDYLIVGHFLIRQTPGDVMQKGHVMLATESCVCIQSQQTSPACSLMQTGEVSKLYGILMQTSYFQSLRHLI